MSEWRDMERTHARQQIHKMEREAKDARETAAKCRRQIRRYQQKIHNYEWYLAVGDAPGGNLDSMARAVVQLGMIIEREHRSLSHAVEVERLSAANLVELRRQLARLDRWKRCAVWFQDLFWPITILRAICAGHARENK